MSSCGRLFCSSCREVVSLKKSVIELHIQSQKHKKGKERQERQKVKEQSIVEALKAYDSSMHPVGETLQESVRVRRVKVVQGLLRAGIPLSKADSLRDLFEENSTTLTSSANLTSAHSLHFTRRAHQHQERNRRSANFDHFRRHNARL